MFDETYSSDHITRGENDTNRYELGRIGEHYVVMNYPSAVTRDENRATKIATDMKSTFMSIRFILLVGVGSAAPCMTNDIRLGDVVFGLEVLPYKQGAVADSENGPYVRSGVAKQPPEELRGAITLLKTGDRSNIQLEEVTDHLSSPTDAAQRPSQDNLYLPDYPCRGEECDCGRPQLHDARLLMERNFRRHINHIMIHEGVVGSADQPMRSVTKRIELSQRDKIICFETGTAGVMDICPCLTIRGISDYADGHKIVDWKPYASLVAAICARKLLGRLQLPEVRELDLPSKPSQVARWMQGATHKAHSTASRLRRSDCKLRAAEQIVNALRERRYILADIIDLDLLKMDKDSLRKAMERDLGQNDTKVIYDRMKSLEVLQLDLIKGLDALERQLHKQTRRRPMLHHRESDDPREWKKLRDQLDVELALAGKLSERIHKCLSTTRRFLPP
ncbi:hypothetical protein N7481_001151 [Penicillium waksmanii]|uniref:uncharacterized protein n=1 Tax=Penicillium waksmanii TaxID=69791 RepID=UPI0025497B83|nr:uncharacterized protein N7481_001151 [Penicillium waksmanii]KAJ6000742.1 hypothetical protein N7481_001151 [Penicillium waksmanii]